MSGPPRKPTRLRILEDNPSKRPLPNNEWDEDVLSGLVRSLGDGADVPGWNERG